MSNFEFGKCKTDCPYYRHATTSGIGFSFGFRWWKNSHRTKRNTSSTLPSVSDSASSIMRSVYRCTSHFHERWHALSSSYWVFHRCSLFRLYWLLFWRFQASSSQTKQSVIRLKIRNQRNHVIDFCACASGSRLYTLSLLCKWIYR